MNDILDAAGAQDILTIDRYAHLIGGARIGAVPEESVADGSPPGVGRPQPVHRRRIGAADQGSANPALTIMATASRLAERLAGRRLDARAAATRPAALRSG